MMVGRWVHAALIAAAFAIAGSGCAPHAEGVLSVRIESDSAAIGIPGKTLRYAKRLEAREAEAQKLIDGLPAIAEKLTKLEDAPRKTDRAVILEIIAAADRSGKDRAFARDIADTDRAVDLIREDREAIAKRIGGAVNFAAKQKGCEFDGWGTVMASLEDAIGKRVEERQAARNEGILVLSRNLGAVDRRDLAPLEELATAIVKASYVVHIELPEAALNLESAKDANEQARAALLRLVEEDSAELATSSVESERAKKERSAILTRELDETDRAEEAIETTRAGVEARATDLRAAYDQALSDLKSTVAP